MDYEDLIENVDGSVFSLLVLIGVGLAAIVAHRARRQYQRVRWQVGDVPAQCRLTGKAVAERLLAACALGQVPVKRFGLTNCYHPWWREIRLRPETYDSASLGALASAAHEVGHAQHFAERIWRCQLRMILWPLCWALPVVGAVYALLCGADWFAFSPVPIFAGILLICALIVILQLPINLPLERDASRRARELVGKTGMLAQHEQDGFDILLAAAWKTHASAELQRWIILFMIALATAGYTWYWSYENQAVAEMQEFEARVGHNLGVPAHPAYVPPAAGPAGHGNAAPVPFVWNAVAWFVAGTPIVLATAFIAFYCFARPRRASHRKLTAEEQAVRHNNAADSLQTDGKHEAAIEEYTRAIELNPQFTAAWHNRGQMYLLTGLPQEAFGDFDRAVQLAPHFADAVVARGHTRLLLGQEEAGMADVERALSIDPTNRVALTIRAAYWQGKDEFDRAIADWSAAIGVDPTCGEFYRNRGLAYYFKGQYDRCVVDQNEALRLDPSDAIALNNRGAALLESGDYAGAASDLQEAIKLAPEFPNPYRHLAWLQATCPDAQYRDGETAVAHATRGLELVEGEPREWLAVLAAAHAEAHEFAEAVRWQQRCLDESPADEQPELQRTLDLFRQGKPVRQPAANVQSGLPVVFQQEETERTESYPYSCIKIRRTGNPARQI